MMNRVRRSVAVVGGGMVGGALALGLAQQGKTVTVIDPAFTKQEPDKEHYDVRISAITMDNIALLEQLGVWQTLQGYKPYPFYQLAIAGADQEWLELGHEPESEQASSKQKPLGYMVENKSLQYVLYQALLAHPQVEVYEGKVARLDAESGLVVLDNQEELVCNVIAGCDGGQSFVRQQVGIGVYGHQYAERCLLAIVKTPEQVPMRTWEVIHEHEMHALLPLANQQACCILYSNEQTVKQWEQSQEHLQQVLEQKFTQHIGEFELLQAGSFPLTRQSALQYAKHRVMLLGDAAHTIHPMGGQGVNLGFRDVKEALKQCDKKDISIDAQRNQALRRYARQRRLDNELMAHAMDIIKQGYRAPRGPLRIARETLLLGMQGFPSLRRIVTAYASGVWNIKK